MLIPAKQIWSTTSTPIVNYISTDEAKQSVTSTIRLSIRKRSLEDGGTTNTISSEKNPLFKHDAKHTSAFTTVHIVISVIGILGLIAVTFTITYLCKRKRRRAKKNMSEATTEKILCSHNQYLPKFSVTTSQHGCSSTSHHCSHTLLPSQHDTRFQQFAMDFDQSIPSGIHQPKPAVIHVENASSSSSSINNTVVLSPMMQQYQLQMKLLQQQKMQKRQSGSLLSSNSNLSSVAAAVSPHPSIATTAASTAITVTQEDSIPPPPYHP